MNDGSSDAELFSAVVALGDGVGVPADIRRQLTALCDSARLAFGAAAVSIARVVEDAHGSGLRYEFDLDKALAALIGHPLLFWFDAPGTRVELLPGEPELLVKAARDYVTITLNPPLREGTGDVVVMIVVLQLRVCALAAHSRRRR